MPLLKAGLCPLLTPAVVDSFTAQGIRTVIDFVSTNPAELSSLCKIPVQTINSVRRFLLAQHSSFPLNGLNLLEQSVKTLSILSTGCQALDDILCSGIYTGEVTEIIGPFSSGKTQMCMSLAVDVAYSLEKSVLYIDRNNDFSPVRVLQILKSRSGRNTGNENNILSRIRVSCCSDAQSLLDTLSALTHLLNSGDNFAGSMKALIVDSLGTEPMLMNLPYVEVQSLMTLIQQELVTIAKEFALAVLVTSQSSHGGLKGSHLGNTSSTVLRLDRSDGLQHPMLKLPRPTTAAIIKSPRARKGQNVILNITESGLEQSKND